MSDEFLISRLPGKYPKEEHIRVERRSAHPTPANVWMLEGTKEESGRWTDGEIEDVNKVVCNYPDPPPMPPSGRLVYLFQKLPRIGRQATYGAGLCSLSNDDMSRTLQADTLEDLLQKWKRSYQYLV